MTAVAMNQVDAPIYRVRGSQPRPVPDGGATHPSRRAPLLVVVVMFGWMFFVFALAGVAAPNDPNVEVPIEVGRGVIVTPADGWYSAAEVWEVGPDAVSLQSSGVYVAFSVEEYAGTNDDLLAETLESLELDFDSFRVLPAAGTTVAGDLPGLVALFSGVSEHWGPENELVVATHGGTGLVMLATGPAGQLSRMQDDLDAMLDSLVVPR